MPIGGFMPTAHEVSSSSPGDGRGPAVGFVVGKPPDRSPVIPGVIERLRAAGLAVLVHVQGRVDAPPSWLGDVGLVVLRGLRSSMLESLLPASASGVRFVDAPSAVLAARDRATAYERLAAAGIVVPSFERVTSWEAAVDRASAAPAVIKHVSGEHGRGAQVLDCSGGLPARAPFPGPYLVEERVDAAGSELKLYRIGRSVVAADAASRRGSISLPDGLAELAERAGEALELSVCGLDVLAGPRGPTVVDVNAFPSARRVPEAADRIGAHLVELVVSDEGVRAANREQAVSSGGAT